MVCYLWPRSASSSWPSSSSSPVMLRWTSLWNSSMLHPQICPKLGSPLKTIVNIVIMTLIIMISITVISTEYLQILDILGGGELRQSCCLHHSKKVDKQRPVPAQDLIRSLTVFPESDKDNIKKKTGVYQIWETPESFQMARWEPLIILAGTSKLKSLTEFQEFYNTCVVLGLINFWFKFLFLIILLTLPAKNSTFLLTEAWSILSLDYIYKHIIHITSSHLAFKYEDSGFLNHIKSTNLHLLCLLRERETSF